MAAGFTSDHTRACQAAWDRARAALEREGKRSPDGSDAYVAAAQAVQDAVQALHRSHADDRTYRRHGQEPPR
ncbi:hypothetical protein ACIBF1_44190 [Spirillospora sp. NPDC050679]